jgi:hypothetical protein
MLIKWPDYCFYFLRGEIINFNYRGLIMKFSAKFKSKTMRKLCAGVTLAASAIVSVPASAEVIQLGFILDRSGSIGAGNWTTIVNGLSNAVNTLIPIGGANTYEVSVVTFATGATIDVNSVVVNNAADRTAVAAAIAAIPFSGGSTDFAAAFTSMRIALTDAVGTAGFIVAGGTTKSYVNFATDGVENDVAAGIAARNLLVTAGIDNISIEGIGTGVDATGLQNDYCYPGPCDTTAPYNFPTQGFYIGVANAAGYTGAIGNKILTVTGTVPEPGSLALIGVALAGLGFSRRKKA